MRSSAFLAIVMFLAPAVLAQGNAATSGSLVGQVVTADAQAVEAVNVTLVGQYRRTTTDATGAFRFDDLRPGSYLLEAESALYGHGHARVEVTDLEAHVTLVLDVTTLHDEVVVTAVGSAQQQLELSHATTVLSGEDLAARRDSSLGETLAQQPGVSSTYFGPGASRPVIRGLGGDRVRMLTGGLGSSDASNVSPDHAVSVDPASAERIEVLRGPSTLLYGSTAIGGVVNVIDNRIPQYVPETGLVGSVELAAGSGADLRESSLMLEGGGGHFAWHADYLDRQTDDVEIPGHAEAEPHPGEDTTGVLENSALETQSGSLGFSWIGSGGVAGLSVSGFETLYGVPGHEHEEDEEQVEGEEAGGVRIDLEQRRMDFKAESLTPFGPFTGFRLRLGSNEYEHRELEGDEIGTIFRNDGVEGRFELVQKPRGGYTGSLGFQYGTNDFEAIGAEAFVPPSTTDLAALFAFQELQRGPFKFQLGGRFERQTIHADSVAPDRDFSGLSGSLGVVWAPAESYSVSLSLARSVRLPTSTELYADGPHIATGAFELGDPNLKKEVSTGLDIALRKTAGRFTATLSLFANRFDDYVFERFTGEEEDGLEVIRFEQADAEFIGGELEGLVSLYRGNDAHFDLNVGVDTVRAELTETGEAVPRIPPRRYRLGFNFHRAKLRAWAEGVHAAEQNRVSDNETPTDSYTMLNAGASYRFFLGPTVLDLLLKGRNLTDEEARNHVSFLKDVAPLPGRDVTLAVKLVF